MKQLSIHLFLVFALLGCGESEPNPEPIPEELIPPSEVGAGFVSCLIDGEVWNVTSRNNISSSLTAGGLILRISQSNTNQFITFEINPVSEEGTYPLFSQSNFALASYNEKAFTNGLETIKSYRTNAEYSGEMVITFLDTGNNIISGTFFFDAIDSDTGEIIEIRDGRFDIEL